MRAFLFCFGSASICVRLRFAGTDLFHPYHHLRRDDNGLSGDPARCYCLTNSDSPVLFVLFLAERQQSKVYKSSHSVYVYLEPLLITASLPIAIVASAIPFYVLVTMSFVICVVSPCLKLLSHGYRCLRLICAISHYLFRGV